MTKRGLGILCLPAPLPTDAISNTSFPVWFSPDMQITLTIPDAYKENPEMLAARAEDVFILELGALWRQYLLPVMRRVTPHRTGQLRRALAIYRDGNRLILAVKPSGFYWYMVSGLPAKYRNLYQQLLPQMVDIALLRTREKIGL